MSGFANRTAAGKALADALAERGYENPLVLALPRGGVPIGAIVAQRLHAPMDLVMVRKIGVPDQPELAAAAVVNGDHPETVINDSVAAMAGLSRADIDKLAAVQLAEIDRRRKAYAQNHTPPPIEGQTAIVVDDGIATGATVLAALRAVRRQKPARLILAIPVAPADTLARIKPEVDEIICLETPEFFYAIGAHYTDFNQVPDSEVIRLLAETHAALAPAEKTGQSPGPGAEPDLPS